MVAVPAVFAHNAQVLVQYTVTKTGFQDRKITLKRGYRMDPANAVGETEMAALAEQFRLNVFPWIAHCMPDPDAIAEGAPHFVAGNGDGIFAKLLDDPIYPFTPSTNAATDADDLDGVGINAEAMAPNYAVHIRLGSGWATRKYQSNLHISPITEDQQTGGTLDPTLMASLYTAGNKLLDKLVINLTANGHTWKPAVVSSADSVFTTVPGVAIKSAELLRANVTIDKSLRTMRKRGFKKSKAS